MLEYLLVPAKYSTFTNLCLQLKAIINQYRVFLSGAYVKPRKGSLVVWWNMDRAGGYDSMTRHGGCPVMVGSKWITNKWVRANAQMFRRPCP